MCGFIGMIIQNHQFAEGEFSSTLSRMSDRIKHRGPDDAGIWFDEKVGIGLAHRRLSVIDLSVAGRQPMVSHSERYIIVYNGEVYNFQKIRESLENSGINKWKGHSDTEVILASIEKWGIAKTLKLLEGMFALAVWDQEKRTLCLARDRMGEKPLYYGINSGALFFGSDLIAFSGSSRWKPEVDQGALGLFMKYGYISAPFSIYKGIYKLPPGTFLELAAADVTQGGQFLPEPIPYWSFQEVLKSSHNKPFLGDCKEAVQELEKLLIQSVNLQKIADVPLGVFLSGGIDSSLVTALLQANSNRPVKSFSIGFGEDIYNEAQHAKAVAVHLGTDHTELYLTPEDVMAVIPDLPEIYSEPFADPSQLPTTIVSRLARQHVTVCLSGDGGDELFCGYDRHIKDPARWRLINRFPAFARNALSLLIEHIPHGLLDNMLISAKFLRPNDMKLGSLASSLKKFAQELKLSEFKTLYDFRISHWRNPEEIVQAFSHSYPLLGQEMAMDDFALMMTLDILHYLPDDILVKVDRSAMSTSLETRVPLLDHRLVEFAASLPLSIKIHNGQQKWPLKQILYNYVPQSLFDRPKMGFGVPMGVWLRGPLRAWAEELLSEKQLREKGYLIPGPVRNMWAEHLAGKHNWQAPLWNVLMFQAWQEKYKI